MIIWVGGGLGNQMFQCALYMAALDKGFRAEADLSSFGNSNFHNGYELDRIFSISVIETSEKLYQYKQSFFAKALRKIGFKYYGLNPDLLEERNSQYIPNLLSDENKNKYLLGYWQTEDYFISIKDKLRASFLFPPLQGINYQTFLDISKCQSVSVHVRRGDYLTYSIYSDLGDSDYYKKALQLFTNKYDNLKFFIFSDDIPWCKENLDVQAESVYIDFNKGNESYIDMQLMSLCKHNIIANSSFSWWGAWLNSSPDKVVVAPRNWFVEDSWHDSSRIIPEGWIKI